jgi:hypothetical protein
MIKQGKNWKNQGINQVDAKLYGNTVAPLPQRPDARQEHFSVISETPYAKKNPGGVHSPGARVLDRGKREGPRFVFS